MTDEVKIEEGTEEQVEQEVVETPEYTEEEERALASGWKPKDKFEGSPEEWRSARDFNERGEMIGKIRSQAKQISSVEAALKHIAAQNTEQYRRGYEQAIVQLKAEKREALANGDLVAAEDIAEKIEATHAQGRAAIAQAQLPAQQVKEVDPDHEPWLEANPWYNNKIKAKWADVVAIDYINEKQGKVSNAEVRAYVTKTYKETFGEKDTKVIQAAPNPDGEGRSNRGTTGESLSKVEQGMSEDNRKIMNTLINATGMTKKEYLEQYSQAK